MIPDKLLAIPALQDDTHRPNSFALSTVGGTKSSFSAGVINTGLSILPNVADSLESGRSDEK